VTGRGDDGAADVAGHLSELFGYCVPEIGLRADGQDRAADRIGVMRAVLFGVGLAGAVHLQDGPGLDRAGNLSIAVRDEIRELVLQGSAAPVPLASAS
jgi:hypothetical protein